MDQKEQKEKFIELSKLIGETGKLYAECICNPAASRENVAKILELETIGDNIQAQLDNHFRTQKNIPYLALDRAKLVRKLDGTLDQIKVAGMTYSTFAPGLPQDFSQKCESIAKLTEKITGLLADAVKTIYTSFADALDYISEIENLRDEAMGISFDLVSGFFEEADETSGWKEFEAITRIIKRTMACISMAKEASEVLELMAYKYE